MKKQMVQEYMEQHHAGVKETGIRKPKEGVYEGWDYGMKMGLNRGLDANKSNHKAITGGAT